jgi:hypothetical protein
VVIIVFLLAVCFVVEGVGLLLFLGEGFLDFRDRNGFDFLHFGSFHGKRSRRWARRNDTFDTPV